MLIVVMSTGCGTISTPSSKNGKELVTERHHIEPVTVSSSTAPVMTSTGTLVLDASAASLDFGSVDVSRSSTQSVTLTNVGTANVTITNVSISGPGFDARGVSGGTVVPPAQSVTLGVTFTPAVDGNATGSLTVTSDASRGANVIAVSGTGMAPVGNTVALTLTATHLTMEQGGQVPPLIWTQSKYPTCTGYPSLSTTATSRAAVGTYTISVSAGTFACTGYSIIYVGNDLDVITSDGNGAQINNSIKYPPGFVGALVTAPIIDVTSNGACNLVGDGVTDNTTCLNSLLSQYSSGSCDNQPTYTRFLYFPPGTYLVSGQIDPCGNEWTLFGSGPQSSVIRLAPNSAAFNTGTNTAWFNPHSVAPGNNNFVEFIFNLGFDVGYGNPNAIPFTTEQNNVGAERNVVIWSEDGNCPYVADLSQGFPGPALFKNVALYGCVNALYSNQQEYSWTFDQITTEGQTGTVLRSGSLKMSIQHWLSDNASTALLTAVNGAVSIIDSELLNGSGIGINNSPGASVFVRNVIVTGYKPSESDSGTGTPITYTGNLTQNWTGAARSLFDSGQSPSSLYLTEAETPLPTDDPTQNNWTVLGTDVSNWCSQITGSLSVTVYAPPGTYAAGSGTESCSIPDSVNHINFYNAVSKNNEPHFSFTVAGASSTPLVIDGCPFFACAITHTGSRTVVLNDTALANFATYAGAGDEFLEDNAFPPFSTGPSYVVSFSPGQSIWARQFDVESTTLPGTLCNGCTLWVLGYKTENYPEITPPITLKNNARAEIFTSFFYPLNTAGTGTAPINLTNSAFFAAPVFSFVNVTGYGWQNWVQEQKGSNTLDLLAPSQNAQNYILNMYYSLP